MWSEDDSAFFSLSMADGSSLSVYGDRDAAGDPLQTTSTAVMTRDGDLVISRFDESQQITRHEVQGQGVIDFVWPSDGESLAFVTLTPAGSEIALRATVNLETLEVSEIREEIVDGAGLAAGASALAATTGVAAPGAAGGGFPGEVLALCDDRTAGPTEGVLPVVSLTRSYGSASVSRPVEDISWTGDRWEYLARPGNIVSATACRDFKSIACPDLNAIPPGAQSAAFSAACAAMIAIPVYGVAISGACTAAVLAHGVLSPALCNGLCPLIDVIIEEVANAQRVDVGLSGQPFDEMTQNEAWTPPAQPAPDFIFDVPDACESSAILEVIPSVTTPRVCDYYSLSVRTDVIALPPGESAWLVANVYRNGVRQETVASGQVAEGIARTTLRVTPGSLGSSDTISIYLVVPNGRKNRTVDVARRTVFLTGEGCDTGLDISGVWETQVITTAASGPGCMDEVGAEDRFRSTITQDGLTASINTHLGTFDGVLLRDRLAFAGTFEDEYGTTRISTADVPVLDSKMEGTFNWSRSSAGGAWCSGTSSIVFIKGEDLPSFGRITNLATGEFMDIEHQGMAQLFLTPRASGPDLLQIVLGYGTSTAVGWVVKGQLLGYTGPGVYTQIFDGDNGFGSSGVYLSGQYGTARGTTHGRDTIRPGFDFRNEPHPCASTTLEFVALETGELEARIIATLFPWEEGCAGPALQIEARMRAELQIELPPPS